MAIAVVDTASATETDGADIVLTLPVSSDTGHVVVAGYSLGTSGDAAMSETGGTWTELYDIFADGSVDDNQAAYLKVMGGTPDSSVTFAGAGGVGLEAAAICNVLSGVDTSTPLDTAVQTATATNGGQPDPPSITTVTDGAAVIAVASVSRSDITPTAPTNYANLVFALAIGGTDTSVASAVRIIATAGAEDPGGFGF